MFVSTVTVLEVLKVLHIELSEQASKSEMRGDISS